MGDIIVKSSNLRGTVVEKAEIPSLIDELPVLMVAASLACGKTVFKGVQELRVKETDRIKSMCENLAEMGVNIKVLHKGSSEKIVVTGAKSLKGAEVKSFGDHRTAMSMVVAGLAARGRTRIDDIACINKSFPHFLQILNQLIVKA
jgi:3-phosphoshikimate 1-carboxyvinyltransferase